MNKYKLIIIFILSSICVSAQDSIQLKYIFGTPKFFIKGEKLSIGKIAEYLKEDKEAFSEYKSARKYGFPIILSTIGWGTTLGVAIDTEPSVKRNILFGVSGFFIGSSIYFNIRQIKTLKKSVKTFNKNNNGRTSYINKISFGLNKYGIGLAFNFN